MFFLEYGLESLNHISTHVSVLLDMILPILDIFEVQGAPGGTQGRPQEGPRGEPRRPQEAKGGLAEAMPEK